MKDWPIVGGDYHPHNRKIKAAFAKWRADELAAFGPNWENLWRDSHKPDYNKCDPDSDYGIPRDVCVSAADKDAEVPTLEPLLMKCRSGGDVTPTDEVSCRTHGRSFTGKGSALDNDGQAWMQKTFGSDQSGN